MGARTFARAKPRHLCMSETDDDVRPCTQLKEDFRILQPCFISATDVLAPLSKFRDMSRHHNYPEPAHALTHTHVSVEALVFFLIFESTDSVLYRAIASSSSSSRPFDQPFVEAVSKAFSCTHIDGQRGRLVFIQPCPASAYLFPPSRMMIIFPK